MSRHTLLKISRRVCLSICWLVIGSRSNAAITQSANSASAPDIQTVLVERSGASQRGDFAKVRSYFTNDTVFKIPGGKTLTQNDWAKLLLIGSTRPNYQEEYAVEKIVMQGETAVVSVKLTESYEAKLKDGSTGKVVSIGKRREHWRRKEQEWRIQVVDLMTSESTTFNGAELKNAVVQIVYEPPPVTVYQSLLTVAERDWLQQGKALFFIYRFKDTAFVVRPPVFLNEQKLAQSVRGSSLAVKVEPGEHRLRADSEDVVTVKAEGGRIYYFEMKLLAGFPKARGKLVSDSTSIGVQTHVFPALLDVQPLEDKYIYDHTKVIK